MGQKTLIGIILSALLAGGGVGGYKVIRDNQADIFENSVHRVVRVIDGDTIDIENEKRIRFLGVDAPDRKACYFEQSRDALEELIEGKDIRIEKDISGTDPFDRLLRYIYIPADDPEDDDLFVNQWLLKNGYAFTLAIAPDNRYRDLFSSAQEDAKENGRGLWSSACTYLQEQTDASSLRERDSEPENPSCTIKGNISEKGFGRQYFFEGCPNYNRIKIDTRKGESYFCSEKEAQEAGFTRSESCDNTF